MENYGTFFLQPGSIAFDEKFRTEYHINEPDSIDIRKKELFYYARGLIEGLQEIANNSANINISTLSGGGTSIGAVAPKIFLSPPTIAVNTENYINLKVKIGLDPRKRINIGLYSDVNNGRYEVTDNEELLTDIIENDAENNKAAELYTTYDCNWNKYHNNKQDGLSDVYTDNQASSRLIRRGLSPFRVEDGGTWIKDDNNNLVNQEYTEPIVYNHAQNNSGVNIPEDNNLSYYPWDTTKEDIQNGYDYSGSRLDIILAIELNGHKCYYRIKYPVISIGYNMNEEEFTDTNADKIGLWKTGTKQKLGTYEDFALRCRRSKLNSYFYYPVIIPCDKNGSIDYTENFNKTRQFYLSDLQLIKPNCDTTQFIIATDHSNFIMNFGYGANEALELTPPMLLEFGMGESLVSTQYLNNYYYNLNTYTKDTMMRRQRTYGKPGTIVGQGYGICWYDFDTFRFKPLKHPVNYYNLNANSLQYNENYTIYQDNNHTNYSHLYFDYCKSYDENTLAVSVQNSSHKKIMEFIIYVTVTGKVVMINCMDNEGLWQDNGFARSIITYDNGLIDLEKTKLFVSNEKSNFKKVNNDAQYLLYKYSSSGTEDTLSKSLYIIVNKSENFCKDKKEIICNCNNKKILFRVWKAGIDELPPEFFYESQTGNQTITSSFKDEVNNKLAKKRILFAIPIKIID